MIFDDFTMSGAIIALVTAVVLFCLMRRSDPSNDQD
jgi:hypothetical protein